MNKLNLKERKIRIIMKKYYLVSNAAKMYKELGLEEASMKYNKRSKELLERFTSLYWR